MLFTIVAVSGGWTWTALVKLLSVIFLILNSENCQYINISFNISWINIYRVVGKFGGELTLFEPLMKEIWQINRSANRLFFISTNLDGFSLANCEWFTKFAKLSCYNGIVSFAWLLLDPNYDSVCKTSSDTEVLGFYCTTLEYGLHESCDPKLPAGSWFSRLNY